MANPSRLSSRGLHFVLLASLIFLVQASPVPAQSVNAHESEADPAGPGLWAYLGTAAALVLLGGAFAGLTIALMGQDEIYLQVIATSGEAHERRDAKKVLKLLKRGKHWVLVTLLLGNVITNETLPIVLDRSLGGGWPAVLGSTVLIVIFGEIAPQSVCVRYGLPIGAWMSPFVLGLMWILAPVAWPTAKLLDYLLGEDHGTTYKKAGLKTLVTLHRTIGEHPTERLNQDEVTIISAVLDLKEKPVGSIMTPMSDVFTLSADTVLDENMMDDILSEGYSRIPIHAVGRPSDFVGMLLVKMLITYDPEDCLRVKDFQLATLPETRQETSCLDIINFFQEGKSHMVLVSDSPGSDFGALGVVTLEDVIEELIGEEIVDESDVFIDVHKAIRRLHPAPRSRVPKSEVLGNPDSAIQTQPEGEINRNGKLPVPGRTSRSGSVEVGANERKPSLSELAKSPPGSKFLMRRRSSGAEPLALRSNTSEMRQHLKHLGPSNAASRPKQTRINTVKIKPGGGFGLDFVDQLIALPETSQLPKDGNKPPSRSPSVILPGIDDASETTGLLSAGRHVKDGAHAVDYGALSLSPTAKSQDLISLVQPDNERSFSTKETDTENRERTPSLPRSKHSPTAPAKLIVELTPSKDDNYSVNITNNNGKPSGEASALSDTPTVSRKSSIDSKASASTLGSLHSVGNGSPVGKKRMNARSGSITEYTVEVGGVKKVILETTSSSDEGNQQGSKPPSRSASQENLGKENGNGKGKTAAEAGTNVDGAAAEADDDEDTAKPTKKRKKKRSGKKKGKGNDAASSPSASGVLDKTK